MDVDVRDERVAARRLGLPVLRVQLQSESRGESDKGQGGLTGLQAAAAFLFSFAALLPVLGAAVMAIEYSTVRAIPLTLAFKESATGLACRGWLVLIPAIGPLLAVGLAKLRPARAWRDPIILTVIGVAAALVLPWPYLALGAAATFWLAAWFRWTLVGAAKSKAGSLVEVALGVVVGGAFVAVALGLTPTGGQPIYVTSTDDAKFATGWYLELTSSTDPVYLLTCSGDEVIAAPGDDVKLVTYSPATVWNVSLAGAFVNAMGWTSGPPSWLPWRGGLPPWGLTPTCPSSPPPGG
jgi:hypothetical protein